MTVSIILKINIQLAHTDIEFSSRIVTRTPVVFFFFLILAFHTELQDERLLYTAHE